MAASESALLAPSSCDCWTAKSRRSLHQTPVCVSTNTTSVMTAVIIFTQSIGDAEGGGDRPGHAWHGGHAGFLQRQHYQLEFA